MLQKAKQVSDAARTIFPLFVIIGLIGLGIWPVIYIWRREKPINAALGADVIPHWVVITQITLLCTTLGLRFLGSSVDSDGIAGLSVLTSLAMGVMWVVFAFKAKATLEHVVVDQWKIRSYRLSAVWTFFFSLFYIVYRLTDLEKFIARHQPATSIQSGMTSRAEATPTES